MLSRCFRQGEKCIMPARFCPSMLTFAPVVSSLRTFMSINYPKPFVNKNSRSASAATQIMVSTVGSRLLAPLELVPFCLNFLSDNLLVFPLLPARRWSYKLPTNSHTTNFVYISGFVGTAIVANVSCTVCFRRFLSEAFHV